MLFEFIISIIYFILFLLLIHRWRFFKFDGFSRKTITAIFSIKILTGIGLTLIYTYYYKERSEADIFKFFDDSKYIYEALWVNPIHFMQLVFGINAEAAHLSIYTQDTKFWAMQTEAYRTFTATEAHDYFNTHRLITRFNAVLRIFSFGVFSVHTIVMCFVTLIGQFALYKTFYTYFKQKKALFIAVIFFIPSVLLWSSGVLKEGFIFLGLGLAFHAFKNITEGASKIKHYVLLLLSLLLLVFVKYYIVAAMIPAFIAYYLAKRKFEQKPLVPYIIIYSVLFIALVFLPKKSEYIPNPLQMLANKQSELIKEGQGGYYFLRNRAGEKEIIYFSPDTEIAKEIIDTSRNIFRINNGLKGYLYRDGLISENPLIIEDAEEDDVYYYEVYASPKAGSFVEIPKLSGNVINLITSAPMAVLNVFFRPHVFEASSVFMLAVALENLLLIFFIIICVFLGTTKNREYNLIFMFFAIAITAGLIIGVTNPVLGAIARHKAPLMPLLFMSLLLLYKPHWYDKFLINFKKKFR